MAYSLSLEILGQATCGSSMLCTGCLASEEARPDVSGLPFLLFVNLAMSAGASPPEDARVRFHLL